MFFFILKKNKEKKRKKGAKPEHVIVRRFNRYVINTRQMYSTPVNLLSRIIFSFSIPISRSTNQRYTDIQPLMFPRLEFIKAKDHIGIVDNRLERNYNLSIECYSR